MAKQFSYTSKKSVDQLINTAINSSNTMRKNVQIAAVHILIHAAKCGDYTKAQTLVDGLGQGVNARGLVEWFIKFGGLTVSEDATGFDGWQGKEYIKKNLDDAKSKMWFEFKPQNPYAGFNIVDAVTKTITSAEKILVTQDEINQLKKFLKAA